MRGLVLSGGGARGAYEAGVLSYLLDRMAERRLDSLDIVCGTSAGATNAAFLAGGLAEPGSAARALEEAWGSLDVADVLRFGPHQLVALPWVLKGGRFPAGLFHARPLRRLIERHLAPDRIAENLAQGRLRALTVSTTHVATGRPVVFVQRRPDVRPLERVGRRVWIRDAVLGVPHVLASAAIPLLFPPALIDGELHCDGGLRLNTPVGPAIRLGARRVLVVSLSSEIEDQGLPQLGRGRYPGATFLLGKLLNAFLLDHITSDLDEIARINRFLDDGVAATGHDFVQRMREVAAAQGEPAYEPVRASVVRPSQDLGVLASQHLERVALRLDRRSIDRTVLRLLDVGEGTGSDLASYLLFDGAYAKTLIALGRADAAAKRDELDAFLTPDELLGP